MLHGYGEGNGTPLQYSCLENPMAEEPGGLQSMGLQRVGHDWETSLSLFTFMNPLHCSCLENPRDGGAWWAAVYGVTQSRTPLKRLSSSSSMVLETNVTLQQILNKEKTSYWPHHLSTIFRVTQSLLLLIEHLLCARHCTLYITVQCS